MAAESDEGYRGVDGDPDDVQPQALHVALCTLAADDPKVGYRLIMERHGDLVRLIRAGKAHRSSRAEREALRDSITQMHHRPTAPRLV